jgi:PncC family amidohydrolase
MREAAPSIQRLQELAEQLAARCVAAGTRVACAESCTGGLVGHVLTEIPGSSAWFRGGVIAYANEVKQAVLGVPPATIEVHGAVSAQAAVAMAEGVRRLMEVDLAVSVTGVAGPSGGTEAKPVGLTYLAVADAQGHAVRRTVWTHDRSGNKRASAEAALELLLERLGPA